jgi:TIR domain/AAA ATPase domain
MAHDVFISFASSDQPVANEVCAGLESRGIRCWIAPRDVSPGTDWAYSTVQAIEESRVLVLIFSNPANSSRQIAREAERATSRGIPLIPFRIEEVVPSKSLEYFLGSSHWIDAFPAPPGQYVPPLADAIFRILGIDERRAVKNEATAASAPAPSPRVSLWNRLFGRSAPVETNAPSAVAESVTAELYVNRLEDLAALSISRSLRAELTALAPGLSERLDRIVRQSDQILRLQDPSRKLEATESALRSLADIQSGLLDQSGPIPAACGKVVARWADLLTAAREDAQAAVEQTRAIENPFVFGNPVHPLADGLFTGRRDIALEIEQNILRAAQTPTLLLYGQRRMGKTSILNQLPTLLGPGFLPVTVDCQAPATGESQAALLRHVTRCLSSALNQRLGITPDDAHARQAKGAEPLPLDALQSDPYSVFEDWLDSYQKRLATDTHLLVCLDEFERLNTAVAAGWGGRFLDALRHWLQHRPNFALMFIGSHTFEQLGPAWTDRFLSARRLKVSFLGAADVRKLLTQPTPTFNLQYAPGALEAIMAATHGQPFLTQALASELVHHMNSEHRKLANEKDVETAIGDALERSAEYFADLWFSRSDQERELLREVARGSPQAPNPVARVLRDYDVLDDNGNFAVPLVKRWVQTKQLQELPGGAHLHRP